MKSYGDCVLAIGESDEYSFVFKRKTTLFNRRKTKILTTIVSQFTSMYVFYWPQFMKTPLQYPPSFDGRIVIYPSLQVLFFFLLTDCRISAITFLGDKQTRTSTISTTPASGRWFSEETKQPHLQRRFSMAR